ncbi:MULTISPECIES: hypothetical protein [Acinetobacter]|uniref:hypothetical protein n=1 Tax=Acinetobacter TaxID=469 RepID=UPI000C33D28A|nr:MULTISPECIES: hypothetical protein [Acinetobacter]MCR8952972.1 hypothetical protein [Acinetobacter baumannii]PKH30664.1 hypothetical protein BJF94_09185 [Acinetobacter radioresistens]
MIISFKSKELRDNAINEFLGMQNLNPITLELLKTILTSLNAASSLKDLPHPIKGKFNYINENICLGGITNLDLHFRNAHLDAPKTSDGIIDWDRVSRLQLTYIGEKHAN